MIQSMKTTDMTENIFKYYLEFFSFSSATINQDANKIVWVDATSRRRRRYIDHALTQLREYRENYMNYSIWWHYTSGCDILKSQ
jgi:hypothetical protein